LRQGNIPVLKVQGKTLPEAWERSMLKVWEKGISIKTEYDRPGDPPSKDCTMIIVVLEPFSEPRIHRAIPSSLEDLEIYRAEVVEGVHDHWICPEEGKWAYTYHKRLFNYEVEGETIDQVNSLLEKLSKVSYSRRAQAITWRPNSDPLIEDPPCLQRVFCRTVEDVDNTLILNMNTHWRSRDAFKAAFMNLFALTDLQKILAKRLSEMLKKPVKIGRHVDISDSYHIYGSYFEEFQDFLAVAKKRPLEQKTWTTDYAAPYFDAARRRLQEEKD
jgi:thymidylate synthase